MKQEIKNILLSFDKTVASFDADIRDTIAESFANRILSETCAEEEGYYELPAIDSVDGKPHVARK